jgi:cell division protein FtsB
MDFHGPEFIIAIIAMSMVGWIITTWIRARHGYPVEGEWGGTVGKSDPQAERKIELLSNENERLTGQIDRLQDRVAVLERIATDKPARLSDEIDSLR